MKKNLWIPVLAGTMLTIAAATGCGVSASTAGTEAAVKAEESTKAGTNAETETNAENEANAENKANPENGTNTEEPVAVVKPLYPLKSAEDALADGGYSVSFTADDLVKTDNGYELTVEVYDYDRYEMDVIDHLANGSKIEFCGNEITLDEIEKNPETGYITINGGMEQGGMELLEEDGLYRTVTFDNDPVYYSVGKVTIPLSEDVTFEDQVKPGQKSDLPVVGLDELPEAIAKSELSFGCNSTVVTVRQGQIVQIIRYWVP